MLRMEGENMFVELGILGPRWLPSSSHPLPLGEGLMLFFGCQVDGTEKYVCDVAPTGTPPLPMVV